MKPRWPWLLLVAALACGRVDDGDRRPVTKVPEPDQVLDEGLMVSLLQAKNFHHKANVHLQDGNVDAAIAELRRILVLSFPAGAAEAEDVRLDARARLAKLLLGKGAQDEALRVVDEGIASATRESYFAANLYTVRGEILETAADGVEGAERDRLLREALEAFDRSLQMSEKIQKRLAEEMGL